MCSNEDRPSPHSYLQNLKTPMPPGRKVRTIARNVFRRLLPRPSTCCGHPGEPGC
jgi:hypothetical protein